MDRTVGVLLAAHLFRPLTAACERTSGVVMGHDRGCPGLGRALGVPLIAPGRLLPWPHRDRPGCRSELPTTADVLITSTVESADSALAAIPNPIPSSGQIRELRRRGRDQLDSLNSVTAPTRRPLLAGLGVVDVLLAEPRTRQQTALPGPAPSAHRRSTPGAPTTPAASARRCARSARRHWRGGPRSAALTRASDR
jgi:hypothetical protein